MSQPPSETQSKKDPPPGNKVGASAENKTMSNAGSTSQLNGGGNFGGTMRSASNTNLGLQLADLKSKRVRVQQDVNMLHNRIRMLRLEEERAMKKIQETRK